MRDFSNLKLNDFNTFLWVATRHQQHSLSFHALITIVGKKIKNTEKTILNFRIVSNDNEEFQTRKLFSVNMGENWFGTIC